MKPLLVPAIALLFTGCQHFSSYQQPYGDNTAEITFTSNDTAAQPVICVPGEGFQSTEFSNSQRPIGGVSLNELMEAMKKSPEVTTSLEASQQARIGILYNQKSTNSTKRDRCRVALQFEALAGEHYQAKFSFSQGQCGLSLTDSRGRSADAVHVDWECPS